jgi:hypothetical protein
MIVVALVAGVAAVVFVVIRQGARNGFSKFLNHRDCGFGRSKECIFGNAWQESKGDNFGAVVGHDDGATIIFRR